MKLMHYAVSFVAVFLYLASAAVEAGLDKWINTELIPTIKGDRPLKIKPYIKITSGGKKRFQLGADSFYIKIGDVTIQTSQLSKRLAQAGCVIETGNIAVCASDVLERELQNIANSPYEPRTHPSPSSPPPIPKHLGNFRVIGRILGL